MCSDKSAVFNINVCLDSCSLVTSIIRQSSRWLLLLLLLVPPPLLLAVAIAVDYFLH